MSCGPFHCAAVSLDGALFTWGEGFGGKLGHGNQNCQEQPTLVEALVGRQVRVSLCGLSAQSGFATTWCHPPPLAHLEKEGKKWNGCFDR